MPVVLKALAPGLAHKTEAGAVRLNLQNGAELDAALTAMAPLSKQFLVEQMVRGALADVELALHASVPVLGNVVVRLGAEAARLAEVREGGRRGRESARAQKKTLSPSLSLLINLLLSSLSSLNRPTPPPPRCSATGWPRTRRRSPD